MKSVGTQSGDQQTLLLCGGSSWRAAATTSGGRLAEVRSSAELYAWAAHEVDV